jgi:hypothetical protein
MTLLDIPLHVQGPVAYYDRGIESEHRKRIPAHSLQLPSEIRARAEAAEIAPQGQLDPLGGPQDDPAPQDRIHHVVCRVHKATGYASSRIGTQPIVTVLLTVPFSSIFS